MNGKLMSDEELSKPHNREQTSAQHYGTILDKLEIDLQCGIFRKSTESTLEAKSNTIAFLLQFAKTSGIEFGSNTNVLNLGACYEYSSHKITNETGAFVTSLKTFQDQENGGQASKFDNAVESSTGSLNQIPENWTKKFDVIWSEDATAHSLDIRNDMKKAFRCLKPGGHMVIMDIMTSPLCSPEDLEQVKKWLEAENVLQPDQYEAELEACGFDVLRTRDLTCHLRTNYARMIERLESGRQLWDTGFDEQLQHYVDELRKRVQILKERETQMWYSIIARKPHGAVIKGHDNAHQSTNQPRLLKRYVTAKLQNIGVTDKSVHYHGSVGICKKLMKASGIEEYEAVQIANLQNGARWTTYAIPLDDEGAFTLNGGSARLGEKGDECVVMTFGMSETFVPANVLCCDSRKNNAVIDEIRYKQQ